MIGYSYRTIRQVADWLEGFVRHTYGKLEVESDFADSVLENDERTFTPNSSPELPAFSRKISRSSS